jgi:hypothetical protein
MITMVGYNWLHCLRFRNSGRPPASRAVVVFDRVHVALRVNELLCSPDSYRRLDFTFVKMAPDGGGIPSDDSVLICWRVFCG